MKWTFGIFFALALGLSFLNGADRPNILFILTDDQVPWAVGVAGHPMAKTPHMDAAPYAKMTDAETPIPHPDYPNLDIERMKRMTREYFSSVRSVDRNLGRVMRTLKDQGLEENTIVIFSSDHGYNMGHNGIWHKGNGHRVVKPFPPVTNPNVPAGHRPNMYDTLILVPTAVDWPGVIQPGTTITKTITNPDWFPTLCAMAGIAIPEEATVRGRDLFPCSKGKTSLTGRTPITGNTAPSTSPTPTCVAGGPMNSS